MFPPVDDMFVGLNEDMSNMLVELMDDVDMLFLKGTYKAEHVDKDGNHKGWFDFPNGITNAGKNSILDTMFNGATQISSSSWYLGLIDNSGTPTLASGDTLASHAGWTEATYYSGNRPAWGQGSAASQQVTNSSVVTFTITGGGGTLYGIFICTAATGTSGLLWSTAAFTATVPVVAGDQMKITYTLAT